MKHVWLVVLIVSSPMLASGKPAERPPAPDPVAASYDELLDQSGAADKQAAAHDDEQTAAHYGDVARAAERWLAHPPGAGRYTTRHEGVLDAKRLVANVRSLRARAAQLAEAAHDRFIEKLEAELHAITPGQRAVVLKRGRPTVARKKALTCWIYRDDTSEETYCWTKAGKIAEHSTTQLADEAAPADEPKPRPARKHARAYYAAATFASGTCSFSDCLKDGWATETPSGTVKTSCRFSACAKDGWTSTYPDGSTATTSCRFGECFKDGWTTTNPDGTESETSCRFSDCMKDGWTTTMPDGTSATTSCRFSDCMKDGWTTDLPSGRTVTCECSFSDCLANGASCH